MNLLYFQIHAQQLTLVNQFMDLLQSDTVSKTLGEGVCDDFTNNLKMFSIKQYIPFIFLFQKNAVAMCSVDSWLLYKNDRRLYLPTDLLGKEVIMNCIKLYDYVYFEISLKCFDITVCVTCHPSLYL